MEVILGLLILGLAIWFWVWCFQLAIKNKTFRIFYIIINVVVGLAVILVNTQSTTNNSNANTISSNTNNQQKLAKSYTQQAYRSSPFNTSIEAQNVCDDMVNRQFTVGKTVALSSTEDFNFYVCYYCDTSVKADTSIYYKETQSVGSSRFPIYDCKWTI